MSEFSDWKPMPVSKGPPFPTLFDIFWPWYKGPRPTEEPPFIPIATAPPVSPSPPPSGGGGGAPGIPIAQAPPVSSSPPPSGGGGGAPTSFYLAISTNGGGQVTPLSGPYLPNSMITITAVPSSGYTFDHWGGSASGTSPSIQVLMDDNKTVVASFRAVAAAPAPSAPSPAPPAPAPSSQVANVSGRVVDATTQLPIAGAFVSVAGGYTSTDGSGNFLISGVPYGTYTVRSTKSGYQDSVQSVTVTSGTNIPLLMNMQPVPQTPPPVSGPFPPPPAGYAANMSGTVYASDTGLPIVGATVFIGTPINALTYKTTLTTDSNGSWSIQGLTDGTYYEVITKYPGYRDGYSEQFLSLGDNPGINITLNKILTDPTKNIPIDVPFDSIYPLPGIPSPPYYYPDSSREVPMGGGLTNALNGQRLTSSLTVYADPFTGKFFQKGPHGGLYGYDYAYIQKASGNPWAKGQFLSTTEYYQ